MSTNGDVPNLSCILGSEIDDLIISIDGTSQDVYSANRPLPNGKPSSLFQTVERVTRFLDHKTRLKLQQPWVRMQIINKEDTSAEIADFIRFWIVQPGVDDVFVKNLDSMNAWIPGLVSEADDRIKASAVATMSCQHLWAIGSMVVTGALNACCHDAKTELTSQFADGRRANIEECTFVEWWNGAFMTLLRNQHQAGQFRLPCAECRERDPWLGG